MIIFFLLFLILFLIFHIIIVHIPYIIRLFQILIFIGVAFFVSFLCPLPSHNTFFLVQFIQGREYLQTPFDGFLNFPIFA